jgi:DNA-binding MarR family transcriptional regulator
MVDRMEQAGWVERRPDPADRRAWLLYITEKAKPLFAQMIEVGQEVREEALTGFTPDERDQVMQLLLRARRNLSERGIDEKTPIAPVAGAAE